MNNFINIAEIVKRLIKYLMMGFAISVVVFCIPKKSLDLEEIVTISLSAASIFCVIDSYIPSISDSTKQGIGLGIGLNLARFAI